MTSKIIYQGQLRTSATHIQSGTEIITDAPVDNHGLGTAFSPTDLMSTSLASCMMTIMGIKAQDKGWNIEGTNVELQKIMYDNPRRVGEIHLKMEIKSADALDDKAKSILINAAKTCPVWKSLHPDIKVVFDYSFA